MSLFKFESVTFHMFVGNFATLILYYSSGRNGVLQVQITRYMSSYLELVLLLDRVVGVALIRNTGMEI